MKKIISLTFALAFTLGLFAQYNGEVKIEGTYRPKVNKVDKIVMKPDTPQQVIDIPEADVKVLEIEHRFHLTLDKLSPLNYNAGKTPADNVSKNFLMAGFGSRVSPVFFYRHNSNLTKDLALGVGLKHYSSWLNIKNYAPSGFMNNALEVGLTSSKYRGFQVAGKVYYKNDVYHYYGIKSSEWTGGAAALDAAAPRQTYNTIGTHFDLTSTTTRNGEMVHNLGLDYHYLFGKVDGGGMEHFVNLSYDLGFADSWWGKKTHPQKMGVVLGVQYGNTSFTGQAAENRLIFKVNPYFEMKDDFYRLHLGVRMDGATQSNITVHSDVKGSLFVLDNTLEFYAGLNGGRKLFTYSSLIEENPFVATRVNMEVTTVKLGFEGGVRTNILNTMDVHVGVRYRHTDNDPFFSQRITAAGSQPYNSFDVIYDETKQVSVLGNVRWLLTDKMTVDGGIAYNKYHLSNEQHVWYRPTFECSLKTDYQFNKDLSFNVYFLHQGGRWAQEYSGSTLQTVKLPAVFDLGLGADYQLNDQITVFGKVDNLLNQKYQRYVNYPVTGIEVFAGLKMRF